MLQTLLLIILVSIGTIPFGLILLLFCSKSKAVIINEQQLVLAFFSGLAIVSLLSSWISLFIPLHLINFAPFLLVAIILVILNRKHFKWTTNINLHAAKFEAAIFIIACILFIQLGSLTPYMADTEIYHFQIVRWYQQFKTVPGLANLFPRYGFYSNWFHYISTYSIPYGQVNLQYLNTTISIWFSFYLLIKIASFKNSPITQKLFFTVFYTSVLLFMFFGWNLLRGNCRSLGNDFIVTLLTLYILFHIIESRILKTSEQLNTIIFIILAVSIPFFKLTGSFILPFLLFYLIQTKQPLKTYGYLAVITVLFVSPFLIKNYIQTGYLLFPYTFLDLFSPDWKLPKPLAQHFQDFIILSNKYIYEGVPDEAWSHSSFKWLNTWFFKLALYDKVLVCLFVISIPCLFFYSRLKNIYIKRNIVPLFTIIPIALIWFFISPDPRFLYGFIILFTFYLLAASIHSHLRETVVNTLRTLSLLAIFLFSAYKISMYNWPLLAALTPEKPPFRKVEIDKNIFYLTQKQAPTELSKCIDLPIPCIYSTNPYLQMRNSSFESGFRMDNNIDSAFITSYIY